MLCATERERSLRAEARPATESRKVKLRRHQTINPLLGVGVIGRFPPNRVPAGYCDEKGTNRKLDEPSPRSITLFSKYIIFVFS